MFSPGELRDAHGRWSLEGLARKGVSVKPQAGGHGVYYAGNLVGHVHGRNGSYTAHTLGHNRITEGPKTHSTIAQAAAHVAAFHKMKGPLEKKWQAPPQPTGKAGERKGGGLTAVGVTNTELGDKVEDSLQKHMGFENAHPGKRQGRFDLHYDGHAYETKAVSQSATEYKAKPKAHEIAEKKAHAVEHGLKPHTMIVVYHPQHKKIHVYSKPGVGAYRLTNPDNGWKYHGSAPLDLGNTWDPTKEAE